MGYMDTKFASVSNVLVQALRLVHGERRPRECFCWLQLAHACPTVHSPSYSNIAFESVHVITLNLFIGLYSGHGPSSVQ